MGEFWGITGDGWIAIATLAGAAAVVLTIALGAAQVTAQLEAGDVRRFVYDDGVLAVKRALDDHFELTRLNYALMSRLLRHMQSTRDDDLARLRVDAIPRALPEKFPSFNAHGLYPAYELIGAELLNVLVVRAHRDLYSVNTYFEIGVRHKLLNYYADGGRGDGDIDSWIDKAFGQVEKEWVMAERLYSDIPGFLQEAVKLAQTMKLRRFRDIDRIRESGEMRTIAEKLDDLARFTKGKYDEAHRKVEGVPGA